MPTAQPRSRAGHHQRGRQTASGTTAPRQAPATRTHCTSQAPQTPGQANRTVDITAVADRGASRTSRRPTHNWICCSRYPGEQECGWRAAREEPSLWRARRLRVASGGAAQMRSLAARQGIRKRRGSSEPVHLGTRAVPDRACSGPGRRGRFWHRRAACAYRDFWATLPISEWRGSPKSGAGWAYWTCAILFGSNRLAMTPLCRTTHVIQRSSANGLAERATAASSARALPRRLDDI
jgi:hypothetical protein